MSEPVYVVRLTAGGRSALISLVDDFWRRTGFQNDLLALLSNARPEHPERQAALEGLAGFLLQHFEFWATDHPGWHHVDAETVEHINGLVEKLRAMEPKL